MGKSMTTIMRRARIAFQTETCGSETNADIFARKPRKWTCRHASLPSVCRGGRPSRLARMQTLHRCGKIGNIATKHFIWEIKHGLIQQKRQRNTTTEPIPCATWRKPVSDSILWDSDTFQIGRCTSSALPLCNSLLCGFLWEFTMCCFYMTWSFGSKKK